MTYFFAPIYLALSWVLPWWFVFFIALFQGWVARSVRHAFQSAFFSVFWLYVMVLYWRNFRAHSVPSQNLAGLVGSPSDHLVVVAVAAIFALAAALVAAFSRSLRNSARL